MAAFRDMYWLLLAILVGVLSFGPVDILAQGSSVVCLSQFNWMRNSKGQNPCVVSAYLLGACYDGLYFTDPLLNNDYYTGPNSPGKQDQCQCNSISYNTMSACGYCQNKSYINWSVWDANCTIVYPFGFPHSIPTGTAVPHWAFQNVTQTDRFNVTLAQLVGGLPESTASVVPSTGSISSTETLGPVIGSLATASPVTTSPPASVLQSSDGGAKTRVIVVGAVTSAVGVVLIFGAAFFVLKRRSQNPTSPQPEVDLRPRQNLAEFIDTGLMFPPGSRMLQPKLYKPSDPSTFHASLSQVETTTVTGSFSVTSYPPSSPRPPSYHSCFPKA